MLLGAKQESKEFSANMLGYAGEFRGGKHEQYEGGVRSPFIIRWPGRINAGQVDTTSVVSGMDWLPTLCSITGITDVPAQLDGEDVSDIWLGNSRDRGKPLFWKTSNPGQSGSLRDGIWKFHLNHRGQAGAYLYNLSRDPAESKNVAANRPEVTKRLETKLRNWIAELPTSYEKSNNKAKKEKKKLDRQRKRERQKQ